MEFLRTFKNGDDFLVCSEYLAGYIKPMKMKTNVSQYDVQTKLFRTKHIFKIESRKAQTTNNVWNIKLPSALLPTPPTDHVPGSLVIYPKAVLVV
jgi:hypothetical protein